MEKNKFALELQDIHTYYSESYVIQGLSLFVGYNEVVSLLGRNGVGKTTTLRSIMGLNPPRSGHIWVSGEETTVWPTHKIVRKGVSYVPTERHIFPGLTVQENLELAERTYPDRNRWTIRRVYEYFPRLEERKKQDGSTLSGGEQQMLAIGRGVMSNPSIMLLDEPSAGLSPILVGIVVGIIKTLHDVEKLSILLIEQNYRMALKLAPRHYLMGNKSKINRIVTTQEMQADEEIIKKHFLL